MNLHTLKSNEVRLVSAFLYDLYAPSREGSFADHLVEICALHLKGFVTGVAYDETNKRDGSYKLYSNSIDQLIAYYQPVTDHISDHPGWRYAMGGGAERVLSIHDFLTDRQFRQTGLYQEAFRHFGSRYQFAVAVSTGSHVGGLTLHRDRPIQDSLRPLLAILAPHIERAYGLVKEGESEKALNPTQLTKYGLTMREAEVLVWVVQGKRDSEIGVILGISTKTVSKHMERIFLKMNVETRGAAVAEIIRMSRRD